MYHHHRETRGKKIEIDEGSNITLHNMIILVKDLLFGLDEILILATIVGEIYPTIYWVALRAALRVAPLVVPETIHHHGEDEEVREETVVDLSHFTGKCLDQATFLIY